MQVLTGLTDAHLENLDMIEGGEYVRKTVEVLLTVSFIFIVSSSDHEILLKSLLINHHVMQDTSEKMQVEAFIWANKDDPDMYGKWDFEV